MLFDTPDFTSDFETLLHHVLALADANGGQQADALRAVIERYDLSDSDGIRLFSAMMTAVRASAKAA